jgi:hypothetical protein
VTDAIAVCAGSCGPGNLHLINGLFDAHRRAVSRTKGSCSAVETCSQ